MSNTYTNPGIRYPKVSVSEMLKELNKFDEANKLLMIKSFKGIRIVVDPRLDGYCFYICGSQKLYDLLKVEEKKQTSCGDLVDEPSSTFSHNEKL